MSPDEERLLEKLRRIEALHASPGTAGEEEAAKKARQRILERLEALRETDPAVEMRFSVPDMWSHRVLMALLRRYGLQPFRYSGQRHTTVMVEAPRRFLEETVWPEYKALAATLREYLDEITNRVIAEALDPDTSDAAVREAPKQLP